MLWPTETGDNLGDCVYVRTRSRKAAWSGEWVHVGKDRTGNKNSKKPKIKQGHAL